MTIHEKLKEIKTQLKVPKSQFNAFGGYKYRSCEDILEALKPYEKLHNVVVLLSDDIVMIGNRYYVKATATIYDMEGNSLSSIGFAREEEQQKGMNAAQITGSASSYSRKYALSALFGLDDSKDPDVTNDHGATRCKCEQCGAEIRDVKKKNGEVMTAAEFVSASKEHYGKVLCKNCMPK